MDFRAARETGVAEFDRADPFGAFLRALPEIATLDEAVALVAHGLRLSDARRPHAPRERQTDGCSISRPVGGR